MPKPSLLDQVGIIIDETSSRPETERLKTELPFQELFKALASAARPPVTIANWTGSTVHSFSAATNILQSSLIIEAPRLSPPNSRYLQIKGLTYSRILAIGKDAFTPDQAPVWHWLSLLTTAHVPDPYFPTGESRLEALWRTLVMNRSSNMQRAERGMFSSVLNPWAVAQIEQAVDNPARQFPLGASLMAPFVVVVYLAMSGRRFVVLENGSMGLAPKDVEIGDRVCLVFGVEAPMVLRDCKDGRMEVIGACYCHGIMEGEGLKDLWDSKARVETFILE